VAFSKAIPSYVMELEARSWRKRQGTSCRQESRRSFRVIDITAFYMNNDELGVEGEFS